MPSLNRLIDHALLKSQTTERQILRACRQALEYDLFGLAVNPAWIPLVARELSGSGTLTVGVAGFPLGAVTIRTKINEALEQVSAGAREIDMVAGIGWLCSGEYARASSEISKIRREIPPEVPLKVIIEAPLLDTQSMLDATQAVIDGGAQFVKSATGFFGESTEQIAETLIQSASGRIGVKISGGVSSLAQAERLVELGADRLGSSASVAILEELKARANVRAV